MRRLLGAWEWRLRARACTVRGMPSFGPVYNWCDRWCERCDLGARRCPLALKEAQRRWVHEARGEDPDDPAVFAADVQEEWDALERTLERVAEEEGIDPHAPAPPEVVTMASLRLRRAGMGFAGEVARALRELPDELRESDAARELSRQSILVASKCARLADVVGERGEPRTDDEVWEDDAVPNLLLLEALDRRLVACVAELFAPERAAPLTELASALREAIGRLLAAVPEEARAELAAMIERGDAPSPFVVVP